MVTLYCSDVEVKRAGCRSNVKRSNLISARGSYYPALREKVSSMTVREFGKTYI